MQSGETPIKAVSTETAGAAILLFRENSSCYFAGSAFSDGKSPICLMRDAAS
jgi:hypothetical protein